MIRSRSMLHFGRSWAFYFSTRDVMSRENTWRLFIGLGGPLPAAQGEFVRYRWMLELQWRPIKNCLNWYMDGLVQELRRNGEHAVYSITHAGGFWRSPIYINISHITDAPFLGMTRRLIDGNLKPTR